MCNGKVSLRMTSLADDRPGIMPRRMLPRAIRAGVGSVHRFIGAPRSRVRRRIGVRPHLAAVVGAGMAEGEIAGAVVMLEAVGIPVVMATGGDEMSWVTKLGRSFHRARPMVHWF